MIHLLVNTFREDEAEHVAIQFTEDGPHMLVQYLYDCPEYSHAPKSVSKVEARELWSKKLRQGYVRKDPSEIKTQLF